MLIIWWRFYTHFSALKILQSCDLSVKDMSIQSNQNLIFD